MMPFKKSFVQSRGVIQPALVVFALIGCDAHLDNVHENSRSEITGRNSPQWQALIEEGVFQFPSPQPLTFPRDFRPHPELRSETLSFKAILNVQPDQRMVVVVQFDRLALRPEKPEQSEPKSQWDFNDLMRALVVVDSIEQPVGQRETIQRVALGLAGVDDDGSWVNADQLFVRIDNPCKPGFHLRAHTHDERRIELQWSLPVCPEGQETPAFNFWTAAGFDVTGSISRHSDGEPSGTRSVSGLGFYSQTFGDLPLSTGALLFDRLQLTVNGLNDERRLLSVLRSKRRSGRGPEIVTSNEIGLDESIALATRDRQIELEWNDEGSRTSDVSGLTYPDRINLSDRSGEFKLMIEPLFGLTEVNDALGSRLQQAVQVSGSHQGMGFLEFQPLLQD